MSLELLSIIWQASRASGMQPGRDQVNQVMGSEVKQQVREFYDQVGWQTVDEGGSQELRYQNARYEDLRPVSHEYIQRCHRRVSRHLERDGRYLLDAGSGPVQYPEYLEYSQGYRYRVCADISMTALKEARMRIGERGLFVVADIANLPFKTDVFGGVVSLHTIHHLPEEEHLSAYQELYRVLAPGRSAVVVNGWSSPPLTRLLEAPLRWRKSLRKLHHKIFGHPAPDKMQEEYGPATGQKKETFKGTFVQKKDAAWLKRTLGQQMELEILVWRSVSVRFLRAYIHHRLAGRWWLRRLYGLEERFPHFFGENGQYPLIVIRKP
jgi:SAM-dependent methyltransferase